MCRRYDRIRRLRRWALQSNSSWAAEESPRGRRFEGALSVSVALHHALFLNVCRIVRPFAGCATPMLSTMRQAARRFRSSRRRATAVCRPRGGHAEKPRHRRRIPHSREAHEDAKARPQGVREDRGCSPRLVGAESRDVDGGHRQHR